jgi:hypothetical protein
MKERKDNHPHDSDRFENAVILFVAWVMLGAVARGVACGVAWDRERMTSRQM